MIQDNQELTPEQEQAMDEQYHKELSEYVANLPTPSPEDIALYSQKIDFMNQIHAEIKAKFPDFQPEYDPIEEFTDEFPKGKYLDTTYKVAPFNSNDEAWQTLKPCYTIPTMKKLEKQFVMNADKVGDNKFIQVKRTDDVAMYRRERLNGEVKGYEVFIVKRRYKGDPLPGGQVEKEDRECYPGANAFGKFAYDCRTEEAAEERYEQMIRKAKDSQDAKEEAARTGKPNKGRRSKAKVDVQPPTGKRFTMKFLVSSTGYNQPQLYPVVRQWLTEGKVTVVGKERAEGGRGKPAVVYEAV